MNDVRWPLLNKDDERRGHVEIVALFPDRGVWRNESGEPYHSVFNALFEKSGAVKMYAGKVKNFSRPTFFSCAYKGGNDLFVMLDGRTIFLLERSRFEDRDLRSISKEELEIACSQPGVSAPSAEEYKQWCLARGRDGDGQRDGDSPEPNGDEQRDGGGSDSEQDDGHPNAEIAELNAQKEEAERQLREVLVRLGQPKFRDDLMRAYGRKCAVTGCEDAEALEAAHIVRFCDSLSNDLSNGVLLRADIHRLFDQHLIGITPETEPVVKVSGTLMSTSYKELDGTKLSVPAETAARPSDVQLKKQWLLFRE
jgi:hypothetical protein